LPALTRGCHGRPLPCPAERGRCRHRSSYRRWRMQAGGLGTCELVDACEMTLNAGADLRDCCVRRAAQFIVSKLWNTYHRAEHVPLALERSLNDLGLDYLDCYMIHFPICLKHVPFETVCRRRALSGSRRQYGRAASNRLRRDLRSVSLATFLARSDTPPGGLTKRTSWSSTRRR
jgi:hypothetical protein